MSQNFQGKILVLSQQPSCLLGSGKCNCASTSAKLSAWCHTALWQVSFQVLDKVMHGKLYPAQLSCLSIMQWKRIAEKLPLLRWLRKLVMRWNLSVLSYQITRDLGVVLWPPRAPNLSPAFASISLPLSMSSHPFPYARCMAHAAGKMSTSGWSSWMLHPAEKRKKGKSSLMHLNPLICLTAQSHNHQGAQVMEWEHMM